MVYPFISTFFQIEEKVFKSNIYWSYSLSLDLFLLFVRIYLNPTNVDKANTSRRSCNRSFQILVFLGYQIRFFLIMIFRQESSREERKKILACSSGWTEPCLIDQENKNQARMIRYSRFFEGQTRIFFPSSRKESYLKFKMKRILSDWSGK